MPRTSCIIPVVGSTDGLETTLLSVLERRPDDCEVLVVLNVPYDDPYQLQGEIQILQAPPRAGLVACINEGIAAAEAPIIHVLASGVEAGDGWIDRALVHFGDPQVAAVSPVVHDAANRDQLLAAGVGYDRGGRKQICRSVAEAERGDLLSVGPLLQAAFYRKSALQAFGGGLPNDVGDELADIDVALSLRAAGWKAMLDQQCRVFGTAIEAAQVTGFAAGLHAERLFWRHAHQTGRWVAWLAHPATALADDLQSRPVWKAPLSALGRFIALCQFGHYRRYQLELATAKAAALAATSQQVISKPAVEPAAPRLRVDEPHGQVRETRKKRYSSAKPTRAT